MAFSAICSNAWGQIQMNWILEALMRGGHLASVPSPCTLPACYEADQVPSKKDRMRSELAFI